MTLRVQAFEIIRTWLFYTLVKARPAQRHGAVDRRDDLGLGPERARQEVLEARSRSRRSRASYNKYDPEDVIDKYGADALRFWAAGSHLGHDLRYHEEDVKAGRKLVLKLWNVARLVEQYAPDFDPSDARPGRRAHARGPLDRQPARTAAARVERGFETYDYAIAREALDQFFWTEFCDDYVELVKDRFWTEEQLHRGAARVGAVDVVGDAAHAARVVRAVPAVRHRRALPVHVRRARGRTVDPRDVMAAGARRTRSPRCPRSRPCAGAAQRCVPSGRGLGLPQGRPLHELVVDADDAETQNTLDAMTQSLAAAARARDIRFGAASTPRRRLPGVRIDIVPEAEAGLDAGASRSSGRNMDFNDSPEEAAWRAECPRVARRRTRRRSRSQATRPRSLDERTTHRVPRRAHASGRR